MWIEREQAMGVRMNDTFETNLGIKLLLINATCQQPRRQVWRDLIFIVISRGLGCLSVMLFATPLVKTVSATASEEAYLNRDGKTSHWFVAFKSFFFPYMRSQTRLYATLHVQSVS